ncbi:aminodeoxychorismate lyase [Thiohalophilus thiocyanatoxydans]|uniref:Aminodeoxychorismate lyase n=1 Tax=Thiohalophilus thiocyanatoxydans TaxID=381308 RepID=A0A4R8IY89_9GAMM|nr:aminodeoxychorismate lyase [Thiohalophilus thiocyanatoxydans]TDY02897.1 aminodeoxychorismate lyase apoprotein [Thiohalophilus thiocyanatoxydans]
MLACRINGIESRQLAITDRACQYGDGLFETLAVRNGKVEFLDAHLQRLADGAQRLGIPMPDPALWRTDIREIVSGRQQAVLKLILTRGSGGRGYLAPADPVVSRIVMLHPWPAHPVEYVEQGVRLRFCSIRLAEQPQLAGIKHLNRLEQILARREWDAETIQEGVMLDTQDRLIEGTMSNLFWLKGDTLHTPDLSACGVQGIMRQQIIDLAPTLGLSVAIGHYPRQALDEADGLFLTNSVIGLWPVRQLEARLFDSLPGLKQIQDKLDAVRWQHAETDF